MQAMPSPNRHNNNERLKRQLLINIAVFITTLPIFRQPIKSKNSCFTEKKVNLEAFLMNDQYSVTSAEQGKSLFPLPYIRV